MAAEYTGADGYNRYLLENDEEITVSDLSRNGTTSTRDYVLIQFYNTNIAVSQTLVNREFPDFSLSVQRKRHWKS